MEYNSSVRNCLKMSQNVRKESRMLTGTFYPALDAKNRFVVPAKLKEQLGPVVTVIRGIGPNKCLTLYSAEEWAKYCDKLNALPTIKSDKITRYIYSHTNEVTLDSAGRLMLSSDMMKFAGITKDIVLLGCGRRAEIWSAELAEEYQILEEPEEMFDLLDNINF